MKSYWLWLFLIPTLFFPNFGNLDTGMGVLETGDMMAIPILILLIIDPTKNRKFLLADYILRPGLAFIFWAVLGILLIYFFYQYNEPNKIVSFSMLKIGKFAMYAAIPIVISRKIQFESIRRDFDWMLLACCVVVAGATIISPNPPALNSKVSVDFYYKASNLISNVLAIFVTYLTGLLIVGYGSEMWRQAVKWSLIIIVIGFSLTKGRGGWIAAICGFTYLAYARGLLRTRILTGIAACVIAIFGLYFYNEDFRLEVSKLVVTQNETRDGASDVEFSDSERFVTWGHEVVKIVNAPIFGTGFHHRGGISGLWRNGSHNFWLQMFLETGLIGGILIVLIFLRMWRHADCEEAIRLGISIPLKATLVTALIGGLGGEYFNGGMGLLSILLCYVPAGAISAVRSQSSKKV